MTEGPPRAPWGTLAGPLGLLGTGGYPWPAGTSGAS